MVAKVCHFYGWSYREVEDMPYKKFLTFYMAITPIEAQKCLMDIKINGFSNMKEGKKREVWNKLKYQAYSMIDQGTKSLPNIFDAVKSFKDGLNGK